ncbi:MAG: alpha/beta fold hydrolase [Candidatus Binataceae bacterium]
MLTPAEEADHLKLAADIAGLEPPEVVLPESHQVVIHRMRFHYLDWGTKGRKPILLFHGAAQNAHAWDLICLMLRRNYYCIALDQRGHGDSEWEPAGDYSLESQTADVEGFIEKLKPHRPLLIGHSMGGIAAIGYALRHAAAMAGLVLIDVAAEVSNDGANRRTGATFNQRREFESVDEIMARAMASNPRRNAVLLRRNLMHNLRRLPNGKWIWKYDPNRDFAIDRAARARKILAGCHDISCPTLIMRGERSDILTEESAASFARALPHGRWIRIANAGHTIHADNPRGLLEALAPFLAEIGF